MESLGGLRPESPNHSTKKLGKENRGDAATKMAKGILHARGNNEKARFSDHKVMPLPRSSVLWEYVAPHPNKGGGNTLEFCLKQEFDEVAAEKIPLLLLHRSEVIKKILVKIFPAIEPTGPQALALLPMRERDFATLIGSEKKVLAQLGFSVEVRNYRLYIRIPDVEALLANWQKMREANPALPELKIGIVGEIVDDMTFIATSLIYDVFLSLDKEFIHDALVHLIPTLLAMQLPNYSAWRSEVNDVVATAKKRIETIETMIAAGKIAKGHPVQKHLDKIKHALGAYCDITSGTCYELIQKNKVMDLNVHFKTIWNDWTQSYWEKKFGKEDLNFSTLPLLWEKIEEITGNPDLAVGDLSENSTSLDITLVVSEEYPNEFQFIQEQQGEKDIKQFLLEFCQKERIPLIPLDTVMRRMQDRKAVDYAQVLHALGMALKKPITFPKNNADIPHYFATWVKTHEKELAVLKSLDLSSRNLIFFPHELSTALPQLETIDLRNNRIISHPYLPSR